MLIERAYTDKKQTTGISAEAGRGNAGVSSSTPTKAIQASCSTHHCTGAPRYCATTVNKICEGACVSETRNTACDSTSVKHLHAIVVTYMVSDNAIQTTRLATYTCPMLGQWADPNETKLADVGSELFCGAAWIVDSCTPAQAILSTGGANSNTAPEELGSTLARLSEKALVSKTG
jgi:hypothetical protein